ncbi:hypothetical protein [Treponema pedis]|uniref:hypothetical protein n=1 Tax=Treponema pedis TaxID=409322 RepID=UPI0006869034|nr:hypothetical protein [Treponema pedis]
MFRNFKNIGFAKAAGFLSQPENISLSIVFMSIPNVPLTLELMEYHNPKTEKDLYNPPINNISGVRHVALKVKDVYKAYQHVMRVAGVRPIQEDVKYIPHKIDSITPEEITLFGKSSNGIEKKRISHIIENTYYCYFIDKYGVQWELEQGHSDIGT